MFKKVSVELVMGPHKLLLLQPCLFFLDSLNLIIKIFHLVIILKSILRIQQCENQGTFTENNDIVVTMNTIKYSLRIRATSFKSGHLISKYMEF